MTEDDRKTSCVSDAPNAAAIRKAAKLSQLPVDRITPVSVPDHYFYR